jgi:ABC-2 type transport system ATP-binding protein
MRQVQASGGKILYNGITYPDHEVEVMRSVACVFDKLPFNPNMKPAAVLKYYRGAYPKFQVEYYEELMRKFNLPEKLKISKYSFGMQKKYNLILGLCQGADILILDEPTSGIDPFDRQEVVDLIQNFMLDETHTVLFSTHITEDLDKIADYIVMMENGKITLDEDKVSLTEHYRLVQTTDMTDELKACAIGVKNSGFGYTFITTNVSLQESDTLKIKIPTVEELFVHLTGSDFIQNNDPMQTRSGKDIFGI